MSAPTPWSGPLPIIFTGSYFKRQLGVGNLYVGSYANAGPGGPSQGGTVFDNLVNPPTTGVGAEAKALTWAQSLGTSALTSPTNGKPWYSAQIVTNMIKKNFDFVMIFYLENSILRSGGVPVA